MSLAKSFRTKPENSNKYINVTFQACTLLGITLIVLKALGYINWSWWIVLSPIYIPIALWLLIAITMFSLLIAYYIDRKRRNII